MVLCRLCLFSPFTLAFLKKNGILTIVIEGMSRTTRPISYTSIS